MISLKKYLDGDCPIVSSDLDNESQKTLDAFSDAYRSALSEMSDCCVHACPPLGPELKRNLVELQERLAKDRNAQTAAQSQESVRIHLREWGRMTARHYQKKAQEVKDILLVMAHTAESVGARDDRCAEQMNEVTTRLKNIASLDDVSDIRASIEQSATELKASIDRMTSAGKAAMEELRAEVSTYRAKLEEAEYIACCDSLTGLGNRLWTEVQIQQRIDAHTIFCAVLLDIDGFKQVNDQHGHMVGDELLKQFAAELRAACRSSDVLGRWGGDEFVVLMDCDLQAAQAQTSRLQEWVCGNYNLQGRNGILKLRVGASVGMAGHADGETMQELLDRADAGMYRDKATSRKPASAARI